MQISSYTAIREGMVKTKDGNFIDEEKYAGKSSIDISIGEIIYHDQKSGEVKSSERHNLLPQETVYLISDELIDIPNDHIAYVFLKNRFSQKGVLAFNTGIIDAGYCGHASTLITNLSLSAVDLKKNKDYFFRIVFQKVEVGESANQSSANITLDQYRQYRIEELERLPKFFLNPEGIKKQINQELNDKALNFGLAKLGLFFAIIGILMILVPPLTEVAAESIKSRYADKSHAKILEMEKKIKFGSVETEKLNLELLKVNASLSEVNDLKNELKNIKRKILEVEKGYSTSNK